MTKSSHIISAAATLSLILLQGCEQDLNLDKYRNPEIENMLVVNSILNPDSVIGVSVTHPYFLTDSHLLFNPVTSLDVRVAGDDGEWETMTFDAASGLYRSARKPKTGEILKIEVNEGAKTATSCDTVPEKVNIEKVQASAEGPVYIFWPDDYRFTYKITFRDTPGEENYYFLAIEEDNSEPWDYSDFGQIDYTADYIFQVLANTINQDLQGWQPDQVFGYPFCDKGIDGELYAITVNEILQHPWVDRIEKLPRFINLYSISKSYFEYMVSVLAMDYDETALKGGLLSLGLMEPTKIYSNIKGGAGLMGCYSLSRVKVDLLQLAGGWPKH